MSLSYEVLKNIFSYKDVADFQKKMKLNGIEETFKVLLGLLDFTVNKAEDEAFIDFDNVYVVLSFLDELVVNRGDVSLNVKKIIKKKIDIIQKIKNVNKTNRINNKEIDILREITNRLENIEINLKYNLKSENILENYNIIKYLVFNKKNISYTKNLIDKYFYLINAYNLAYDNSFIDLIIEEYLTGIREYAYSNKTNDLYYYDNVLEEMLNNSKILIEEDVKKRNIKKIKMSLKEEHYDKKQLDKVNCWYNHLLNFIKYNDNEESIDRLNSMYNVRFYFNTNVLDEADSLRFVLKHNSFVSNNSDYIISIDNDKYSVDKDDAISVKKSGDLYELKVYIADPNSICAMDSLMAQEAKKRGQSLYLMDNVYYMFPEEIIKNTLSLDENKNRHARVYTLNIDSNGEIISFRINKEIINVNNNFSYKEINKVLTTGTDNENLNMTLENLLELKSVINKSHIKQEKIDRLTPFNKSKSEKLIELFMILTNYETAKYFYKNGLPFIYRNHILNRSVVDLQEELSNISNLEVNEYKKIINDIAKNDLSATYSIDKPNHEGLNLDYYSHVSSPLRRYADVIANSCEDMFYFKTQNNKELIKFEKKLRDDINSLNEKNSEVLQYYKRYSRVLKK